MEDLRMNRSIEGLRVFVTGGSRGIGRAVARAYASGGSRIALTFKADEEAAAGVVDEIVQDGHEAFAVRLDLGDRNSIATAVDVASERLGGLDVAVANAIRWPIEASGQLSAVDPDAWETALRTNLEGTAATARAVLPHLAQSDVGRLVL